MDRESWRQVKKFFHVALECDPGDRARFLREACAEDTDLLAQVESLIRSHEQAGDFIIEPAFISFDPSFSRADELPALSGQHIGSYKIVRELGRGGMGAVYLAARADEMFDKEVAIKVIKRGMDTDFVLRRFARERQVLASLDHPNIAKLLDGGVIKEGLPYFIMEYVEGVPLNEYADERKLSVGDRLELFRSVCSAIHYAHQHLIVHRDIKPSNIIVTADGIPKLLDFGIAKLLKTDLASETVDNTHTALRLMTPEYASPEQVRGESITTASDVYSLGVLLYELLTGHRPYRLKQRAPTEIARVICEQEPDKPSQVISRAEESPATGHVEAQRTLTTAQVADTRGVQPERLRRQLAGDLDNIIFKAMHKDPQRRYASAEQLSEDIQRHLDGLPVAAQPDTFAYRSRKFIRRHRAGVMAAALIALTLVAGATATAWEAHQARLERARAERRFNDVRHLANSFLFEFHDSIRDLSGATRARELIVKRALEYLDSLAQEAQNDPALQRELATAYEKLGDIQSKTLESNLGNTAGAHDSYSKALSLRETIVAAAPTQTQSRSDLASSYSRFGMLLWATDGKREDALKYNRKASVIYEELVATDPTNSAYRFDLANSYLNNGMILLEQGDAAGALENHQRARAIYESLTTQNPGDKQVRRALSRSYEKIGNVLLQTGDAAGALELNRRALALRVELSASDPTNADYRRGVEISHEKIGDMLSTLGDLNGALESYRQELSICEELAAADPVNAQLRSELSSPYQRIGVTLSKLGDLKGALTHHRKALELRAKLAADDPMNLTKRWDLIESRSQIGNVLAKMGDLRAALENCLQAASLTEATANNPLDVFFRRYRARAYVELGGAYATIAANASTPINERIAHWRDAHAWYERAAQIYSDMRRRRILGKPDESKPDEIAVETARCDEALAKLQGRLSMINR